MSEKARILAEVLPRLRRPRGGAEVLWIPDLLAIEFVAGPDLLTLSRRDLQRAGLTPDDLMPPALANLQEIASERAWIQVETVPGLRIAWAPDGLAASRALVLRTLVEPFPLEGVIVALPSPDQLLAVALESSSSLEAARILFAAGGLAFDVAHEPLTDQAFWLEGDRLHVVPVHRTEDEVAARPPRALAEAFERLALLGAAVAADA